MLWPRCNHRQGLFLDEYLFAVYYVQAGLGCIKSVAEQVVDNVLTGFLVYKGNIGRSGALADEQWQHDLAIALAYNPVAC